MKKIFYNFFFLVVAWCIVRETVGMYQEKILDKKLEQEANKIDSMLNDYFESLLSG